MMLTVYLSSGLEREVSVGCSGVEVEEQRGHLSICAGQLQVTERRVTAHQTGEVSGYIVLLAEGTDL